MGISPHDAAEVSQYESLIAQHHQQMETVATHIFILSHHHNALFTVKECLQSWGASRKPASQVAIAIMGATGGEGLKLVEHGQHGCLTTFFEQIRIHYCRGTEHAAGKIGLVCQPRRPCNYRLHRCQLTLAAQFHKQGNSLPGILWIRQHPPLITCVPSHRLH